MPPTGLVHTLVLVLGLTPPQALDAERLGELHDSGLAHRTKKEHLLAADAWLAALGGIELTAGAEADVENHFCEAVKSLQDAAGDVLQAGGVDERVQAHRGRLTSSEAFLRRSASGASACLTAWEALERTYPPPAPSVRPVVPAERPSPPRDDSRRGLRIGFYSSLAVTLGFTAAALGTGLSLKPGPPDGWQGPAYAKVWDHADETTRNDSDLALCGSSDSGALKDACDAYRHTQRAAMTSIVFASVGLVTTAVLGGLLRKGRGRALPRDVALRGGGMLTSERFLLHLRVNF